MFLVKRSLDLESKSRNDDVSALSETRLGELGRDPCSRIGVLEADAITDDDKWQPQDV